jgi:hypothetical protein
LTEVAISATAMGKRRTNSVDETSQLLRIRVAIHLASVAQKQRIPEMRREYHISVLTV